MSTLNIVNKSPFEKRTLEQCLPRTADGDSILLIEDACVAAVDGTSMTEELALHASRLKFYVLKPDLDARGLGEKGLIAGCSTVDYPQFVELVTNHDRVHSWL